MSVYSALAQSRHPGQSPGRTRTLWEPLKPLFLLENNRAINHSTLGLSVSKPMSLPCQGRSQLSLFVKLQTSYTNRVVPRDGSLTKKTKSSAQQR